VGERVIDLAAIEEGVDQPAAGFWLLGEEGCPMPAGTTSWTFGR
jgi:hypothetical protein